MPPARLPARAHPRQVLRAPPLACKCELPGQVTGPERLWEDGTAEWISVKVKRHFQALRLQPLARPLCLLGKTEGIVLSKRHHNIPAYATASPPPHIPSISQEFLGDSGAPNHQKFISPTRKAPVNDVPGLKETLLTQPGAEDTIGQKEAYLWLPVPKGHRPHPQAL
ncbi:putative uncharacterized protein GUCA1ANB isoform X1 [Lutra lutra]|uniref:putative uncharacterized protein GUCA1ANB isoform X1 n=1 Tax=Lutra lutra TaxID=9657 RepID=UPI001FD3DB04|nr:putative uncharacterized protein GUCA1ANB isoform X1 [Lutra lutra]